MTCLLKRTGRPKSWLSRLSSRGSPSTRQRISSSLPGSKMFSHGTWQVCKGVSEPPCGTGSESEGFFAEFADVGLVGLNLDEMIQSLSHLRPRVKSRCEVLAMEGHASFLLKRTGRYWHDMNILMSMPDFSGILRSVETWIPRTNTEQLPMNRAMSRFFSGPVSSWRL